MRLALEHLDARAIDLDLGRATGREQCLRIRTASALKGVLKQGDGLLQVSDVEADWVVLDASQLDFGTVSLALTREATLGELRAAYAQGPSGMRLDLSTHGLHAALLDLVAGTVRVGGEARFQSTKLHLEGSEGGLEAETARVEGFRLRIGALVLGASELSAESLVVGWGAAGFRLEARKLTSPDLTLEVGATKLVAKGLHLRELRVNGPKVSFAEASVTSASLDTTFSSEESGPKTSPAPASPGKVFDFALLDGLSGRLAVDAVVDMTVPLLGNRRATHKLRLDVDEGTIDFRELENDLSALEESLLDFAVRDDALVLERGIPLLPTRGFGKPLVIWDLGAYDLALAHKRRVRLSVLPKARLAKELKAEDEERAARKESRFTFALRRLGLENIALELALHEVEGPVGGALSRLTFERVSAHGSVQHELQGAPRPGEVRMEVEALETRVRALKLGELVLDVPSLKLQRLRDAALSFTGLKPTQLRASIDGLKLERVSLA